VQEELRALRWEEQDLVARLKGDLRKVRIAARLRRETTMTLLWVALGGEKTTSAVLCKSFVLTP